MQKRGRDIEKRIVRPNNVLVDTSAWIALFSRRDQNHPSADNRFRKLIGAQAQLLTTNLVLAEVHRLILHRAGVKAASAALSRIEASPLVRIEFADRRHHQSAKEWISRLQNHTISYTDAVSFAVMKDSECPEAFSYDHHFSLAGFTSNP